MVGIESLLTSSTVTLGLRARCKREVLSQLAEQIASSCGQSCETVLDTLMEREKLGSTGVGNGVAIPHGKIDDLPQIVGAFARLETPVDFDALDGEPVDLVFVLLAPSDATAAHLKALARVARLLRDDNKRDALRQADDIETVLAIAANDRKSDAA